MARSTPLSEVKGIGPSTAQHLRDAGIDSVEKLAEAKAEKLSEIEGIGESTAKKYLERAHERLSEIASAGPDGEGFHPQDHFLVPKHEVLEGEQIQEFYDTYDVQPTNLPTIYINDPALQGMDIKIGDIIRIHRRSLTAGDSTFYRRVAYE